MKSLAQILVYDVRDFTTLSPQVKFLLSIQLIILFILSILVGVLFSPKFKAQVQQQNVIQPSLVEEQTATLSFEPKDIILKSGEEKSVSILLSGKPASAVDIVLSYDPTLLQITNMTNGDVFDQEIINKQSRGKIQFSAARSATTAQQKEGIVATMKITALKKTGSTATSISFIKDETIVAESGINILGLMNEAVVRIFD
ncbi:hypothetical protein A3H80_01580 [Candidatus Roizmanbacteria bacterium RIFCSPLOWO2_02_FULL_37_19]|uniref:Cohesin domain-containing protein n=1 Tax=Candidatus Roizmanbacteria bacterium RIFCSPHIGHO2_02_FULL_37_24 TaxID=1802037 RepID=A0A1F7GZR5_9BACT|nr:MAG: hypothetical protein A2862_04475 [Candidatus Roizmanbacteria bacterium RIFCSPHIGHO2_01_FULL_38_41]OGK24610.1 MAG: hypothetical protein A3C24_02360 [Candidatus Roizmanbacteria bacterium RIFCSPHIGHO2_02_FULL_37_24]OGK32248.1 MAG: hypothetical protein A3E10_02300 [Candidatus Roizmanbacteria bacterium RIFCSPHIGHO2_12_FULL_37_23]OGK45542.1 MAG: hypothetical protein A2956_03070 [Candidatus Roizmanbacteria bacterium RIFCSPLOWO2_01_FULL_37_57]OGK53881.1 MAG: hypothetical protein A3H80_01580 [Ca